METYHFHKFFLNKENYTDQQEDGNHRGVYSMFRTSEEEWFADKGVRGSHKLHGIDEKSSGIDRQPDGIIDQGSSDKK